ncbi:MAG: hypothetical protein ACTSO9_18680 [Candidatus Helarchaeota archaeon]
MGASPLYHLEFLGNKLLGYSILDNPMEVIGLGILMVMLVFVSILSVKLYKSYKETKMLSTLYFFLAFFFFIIAAFFLILEKFSYSTLGNVTLGDIGGVIALNFSGVAIICMNLFAINNTYPERIKIYGTIISVVTEIYTWVLCWAILTGPPIKDIINYEIIYGEIWIDILIYVTAIPVLLIAPLTFLYFAYKTKAESPANSRRSKWFGIGIIFFDIAYILEIAPFFPSVLSIPFRSFFIISVVILYICFTKDWTT